MFSNESLAIVRFMCIMLKLPHWVLELNLSTFTIILYDGIQLNIYVRRIHEYTRSCSIPLQKKEEKKDHVVFELIFLHGRYI